VKRLAAIIAIATGLCVVPAALGSATSSARPSLVPPTVEGGTEHGYVCILFRSEHMSDVCVSDILAKK
jgi:hypothetical protein